MKGLLTRGPSPLRLKGRTSFKGCEQDFIKTPRYVGDILCFVVPVDDGARVLEIGHAVLDKLIEPSAREPPGFHPRDSDMICEVWVFRAVWFRYQIDSRQGFRLGIVSPPC